MNNIEFIDYTPVADQKHFAIIAVKWAGIVLRFKAVIKGDGFFVTTSAFLVKDKISLEDRYEQCFEIDSRSEHERVINFVKAVVKKFQANQGAVVGGMVSIPSGMPLPANANWPPIDERNMVRPDAQSAFGNVPF